MTATQKKANAKATESIYAAEAAGKDHLDQAEEAVRTVRQARTDRTAAEALAAGVRSHTHKGGYGFAQRTRDGR